jgi:hypothetical protein
VHVETTEFLVHRCRRRHPLRDYGIRPQDHLEVAECSPKILARVPYRSRALAMRQVSVE